jgi:FkbM family methyltransferase
MINPLHLLRTQAHPLHRLRRLKGFQAVSRHFDPIVKRQPSHLPRPIHLRLVSHASLLMDGATQEASVLGTFVEVLYALHSEDRLVFWDVGANIGGYSWKCAALRPMATIVSFEPDAKNLECLHRTSRAWRLSQHAIVPAAVADVSGRAVFCPDDITGTTGTLQVDSPTFNAIHYGRISKTIEVETISLDDFVQQSDPPSIIKVDVEGAEMRVLRGAVGLLNRYLPVLLIETFEHRDEVIAFLKRFGYEIYDSDRRERCNGSSTNMVAFVRERHPSVVEALSRFGYPVGDQKQSTHS